MLHQSNVMPHPVLTNKYNGLFVVDGFARLRPCPCQAVGEILTMNYLSKARVIHGSWGMLIIPETDKAFDSKNCSELRP